MPVNRNALIRFRTIDTCLKNRQRRWTLDNLVDAVSETLYEYEGIDKGVSKRTVQMDIQLMRSDKLGYNAPIVVLEKKYYTYEDPDYSITNIPLTDQDLGKLTEVVEILRQFKGFSHFQELSGMVQRLENKIDAARTNQEPVIDFEKNDNLKGLEHIDTLYQAIVKKNAVELCYQSFKARSANTFNFHPYYLKEYRNRWFVLGVKKKNTPILNLALDRIITIQPTALKYVPRDKFNISTFLNDVVGVSVNPDGLTEKVLLQADQETAPYILTKPIHNSQKLEETTSNGVIVSLQVQLNFELEREILGFGNRVKVLAPEKLKRRVKDILTHALDLYQYEFNATSLQNQLRKLEHRGFAIMHHVFGKKEVNALKQKIQGYLNALPTSQNDYAIRGLLQEIPAVHAFIFNSNLKHILKKINPQLFLTKAIFFDKTPDSNWYVTWHQDTTIHVTEKIETDGFTGWTKKMNVHGVCPPEEILKNTLTVRIHLDDADETNGALKVVPGSQNKKLTAQEIALIVQNSLPVTCEVQACGVHILRPLLIHSSSKATSQKHRKVIHLEFNTVELPNGLQWAERAPLQ
ncbi:WYL domain-containing protein [Chryseolinea lacunae]|uniref:WYL domain-containing protein n=1 Tax=Chryseolinea lacunae TaxID=2801331 RepID=A0ABS1KUQ6_9BACT|nr:WYL domain-containing protein [Chryseolinea lacunae]MBL0742041.1 WYL domain-containing protein [Chryseolinea lacunae]